MPLDPSFRSRLRDALQQSVVGRPLPGIDATAPLRELRYEPDEEQRPNGEDEQAAWIADLLGGWWNRDAGGVCLVVDRKYPADWRHGQAEIGCYAETLERYQRSLRRFQPFPGPAASPTLFTELEPGSGTSGSGTDSDADGRMLFFDLETTGLSGGAGTCAFLIGYGWFDAGAFHTRQYFLSGLGHEPALLRMAAEPLGMTGLTPCSKGGSEEVAQDFTPANIVLASFNGKTFDVPLITGRYLFHRVPSPFDDVPHVDLLHPARRLWRYRPSEDRQAARDTNDAFARYFRATAVREGRGRRYDLSASAASCALGALEDAVLGFRRTGDVPGAEIPTRYFHFVRTGDARPLARVLEHNRLDLVSLAALSSLVARMLEEGPQAARNPHECLALGRLYERSGAADRATACYERAIEGRTATWREDPVVQREALRRLAVRHRRDRRYDDAAAAWQRLLDLAVAPAAADLEALQALAVHHEHRSGDLQAARDLVLRALEDVHEARLDEALRRRLSRLERKLGLGGM